MDLHAWITERVDAVEASVLAELEGRRITLEQSDGGPLISGVVTDARAAAHGPDLSIVQRFVEPRDERPAPVEWATAVLRRCEADRRILAIHRAVNPDYFSVACDGCGQAGELGDPVVGNVNDCPVLLAIAHAHGITSEILEGLDRPEVPKREYRGPRLLADVWGPQLLAGLHAGFVPPTLRGPNWRERTE